MSDDFEKISRRRRGALAVYGIMFLALQGIAFKRLDDPVALWRGIHYTTAFGYMLWASTLIYILASGGFPFHGRSATAQAVLNDELTVANRRFAYQVGYWTLLAMTVVLFALAQSDQMTIPEAMRVTFAIGVAVPAIAFAGRERRQGG